MPFRAVDIECYIREAKSFCGSCTAVETSIWNQPCLNRSKFLLYSLSKWSMFSPSYEFLMSFVMQKLIICRHLFCNLHLVSIKSKIYIYIYIYIISILRLTSSIRHKNTRQLSHNSQKAHNNRTFWYHLLELDPSSATVLWIMIVVEQFMDKGVGNILSKTTTW